MAPQDFFHLVTHLPEGPKHLLKRSFFETFGLAIKIPYFKYCSFEVTEDTWILCS